MSLQIDRVCCWRGDRRLFSNVCHTLGRGELVQLEGENGAGKTSLLRIVAGLSNPEEGDVLWQKKSIYDQKDIYNQAMLYVGHKPGLKDVLTAHENLAFYQRATAVAFKPEKIPQALEEIGLRGYEHTPVNQLSAGQQRRVALARLYLTQASIWLLDEPFTAIDKQGVSKLVKHFQAHCESGGIVLFTSHQSVNDAVIKRISLEGKSDVSGKGEGVVCS